MAISKIIYKSSAQDTGTVWMDVTQKTVTAGTMLNGTTALKNDGTDITGSIASKSSSDLTANVLTVTAPAGHYASAATKTLTDQYLLAENIKKDISIFGVTGTYEGGGGGTTWETTYEGNVSIISSTPNYIWIDNYTTPLLANETYRVTYGNYGTYILETYVPTGGTYDGYAMGNTLFDEPPGVDTEVPFNLYRENANVLVSLTNEPAGTIHLKIEKQVSGGGGGSGLVYESGTYTPAQDVAETTINFTDTHTTRPFSVVIWDTTGTTPTSNSNQAWSITSWYDISGDGIVGTSGGVINYARVQYSYWSTSTSSTGINISELTGNNNTSFGYWVSSSEFKPRGGASSRYWRSGRTYKWIAVWAPST